MKEREFLEELQKRAKEQQVFQSIVPFPKVFFFLSTLLGQYPWRLLIPIGLLLSAFLFAIFKRNYTEWILTVFGAI